MSTFTQPSTVANPSHESLMPKKFRLKIVEKDKLQNPKNSTASTLSSTNKANQTSNKNNKQKLITYSNKNKKINYIL
jgi:hypothetical protein